MTRIPARRMFLASLVGAAAFFVVPAICVVIGFLQMPYLNADGTPDNGPVRGAAAFVLLSPALFLVIAASAFLSGRRLQRIGYLASHVLLRIVLGVSIAAGLLPALDARFGWVDALTNFSSSGRDTGAIGADARRST